MIVVKLSKANNVSRHEVSFSNVTSLLSVSVTYSAWEYPLKKVTLTFCNGHEIEVNLHNSTPNSFINFVDQLHNVQFNKVESELDSDDVLLQLTLSNSDQAYSYTSSSEDIANTMNTGDNKISNVGKRSNK